MKGIVKWYNAKKCYGFIESEDGKDVFIHKSAIPFWTIILKKGDKIEFEIESSNRGLRAINVKSL